MKNFSKRWIIGLVVCAVAGAGALFFFGFDDWRMGFNAGAVSAEPYVTREPKVEEVAADYVLVSQTVTPIGLSALDDHRCRLFLKPDGTFEIENYINWADGSF